MADILTKTASDLENGVYVLPALGADGLVRILVANHKYRMDRTTDLTITLPASVTSNMVATRYLIDAAHSDFYDQGGGTGVLETVTSPTIVAGQVTITMQPRSVSLLEFAVPPPTPTTPSPGGSNLPGGTTVYSPRKRARKTGFKRRRM